MIVSIYKKYENINKFKLRDAACLWLEIEPGSEDLALEGIEQKLHWKLFAIFEEKLMRSGQSKEEAICNIHKWIKIENSRPGSESRESPNSRTSFEDIFRYRADEGYRFFYASRGNLKKVAEALGEKPKFLFPEMDDSNMPNLEDKPLSTKKRNSYLKLIKGLLIKEGFDPSEGGIAKTLSGMVKDANQTLGDDTIRKILDEVQALDED